MVPLKPIYLAPIWLAVAVITGGLSAMAQAEEAASPTPEQLEFFEKRVRPILVENCHGCHAADKQKGGLRLDSRAAILVGGDTGPAIEPGDPDASLLVDAIRYSGDSYQMPPSGKLDDDAIAHLTTWVASGAPWPIEAPVAESGEEKKGFDLAERSQRWTYQPLSVAEPPAVVEEHWPRGPIDRFVLARLEAAGLRPAPEADRRDWLRRVTFDLIGLPPTRDEIEQFVADTSPEAYDVVVDRLLASPHYGERWGRHWLDLMRYAETLGHEFDYELFHAWRYRDYVIRAFNADVPYDQFVLEHLAGDLLETPRRHPTEGFNESVLGTGFYWLCEGRHSPVDLRQTEAERFENQIDTLGKAFLGLTIACARCHDHKFDAITTKDYYALAGYLKSSRYQQAYIDPPSRIAAAEMELRELQAELEQLLRAQQAEVWLDEAARLPERLLAVGDLYQRSLALGESDTIDAALAEVAEAHQLEAEELARWWQALNDESLAQSQHPLDAWRALHAASAEAKSWSQQVVELREALTGQQQAAAARRSGAVCFADFDSGTFETWQITGEAFGEAPSSRGDVQLSFADEQPKLRFVPGGYAASDQRSPRFEGVLTSSDFTIDADYVHILARGRAGRVNLVIDGFTLIRDPIYGGLCVTVNGDAWKWYKIDVRMWRGQRGYLELVDSRVPNLTQSMSEGAQGNAAISDYLAVDEIWFSDEPQPPAQGPAAILLRVLEDAASTDQSGLAASYGRALRESVERWRSDGNGVESHDDGGFQLFAWLVEQKLLSPPDWNEGRWAELLAEYRTTEAGIEAPRMALAMADGTANDEYVFVRGNYKVQGEPAPRRFLEVFVGDTSTPSSTNSGRLELARKMLAPDNPLPARVMVNRLWQHHFGRGIVASVDDFGLLGELPSHPELLDYLAGDFIEGGWSLKRMHRQMVLSSAYRMSNEVDENARRLDPANRWLHHMPLRRLEAEAVRDAMLAVSGRLDRSLYGPPIMPHLPPGTSEVGRPATNGPLDGEGRRSIYVNVRRNFLPPLMVAFDFPPPVTTMGRRTSSNTPTQALSMMNNPFVRQQAELWARRVLAEGDASSEQRLETMYLDAFGRLPDAEERAAALEYLERLLSRIDSGDATPAWTELAHALFNVKTFVYVP